MNENKKKMYDLSGPKTVEAMKKRHFDAYYCSTAAEAVEKALELIPKTDSVSWGGVMTVDELGLKQRLAQEGYTLIDRDTAKDPAEKQALMHQALSCGTFLTSSNAISKDGQLVNIDGMGNRVAAMCYGPRQVVVIAGVHSRYEQGAGHTGRRHCPRTEHRCAGQRAAVRYQDALRPDRTVRRLHQSGLHLFLCGGDEELHGA